MIRGFLVGRFQPFQKGHLHGIEKALEEVDELVIGIGSSQFAYTQRNPFTLEERIEMIEKSVSGKYRIIAIPDIGNYDKWVKHVENLTPKIDIVYTGSSITRKLFEKAGYEVRELSIKKVDGSDDRISATQIRGLITVNDKRWKELVPEGTLNVIEKCNGETRVYHLERYAEYPKATLTVDTIAKYRNGIVFIKRKIDPYKDKFAFPGGHVELGEPLADAAKREFKEETGLDFEISGILDVYARLGRDPRGYTASITYYGKAIGTIKAGDDAKEVIVLSQKDIPKDLAFDHYEILEKYFNNIKSRGEGT